MVDTAVKAYIDSTIPVVNLVDTIKNSIVYKGDKYTITNTWTLSATKQRIFPVTISAVITLKNGKINTIIGNAKNQTELTTFNSQLEQSAKSYIDANTTVSLVENVKDAVPYNGGYYTISNTWTQGVNNTRAFPVTISISARKPGSTTYPTLRTQTVSTEADRLTLNANFEKAVKEYLDTFKPSPTTHTPNQLISYTGKVDPYYNGWYEVLNQWNLSGTTDFPVKIIGTYSLPTL